MKKITILLLTIIISVLFMFALSSCGDESCEHTYGEWTIEKEATCTEKGLRSKTCSKCTEKVSEEIAIKGHTEQVLEAVSATCIQTGLTEGKKCSVCNEVLVAQTEVAKGEHTIEVLEAVASTCSTTGLTEGKKCSVCNEVLVAQTEVAKNSEAHVEEIIPAVEATCGKMGLTEGKKCTLCKKITLRQTMTPKTDVHTPVKVDRVEATCVLWGREESQQCSVCEVMVEMGDQIPPIEHQFDESNICKICKVPYRISEGLEYDLSDDGTYYILKSRGTCTDKEIIIPDEIDGVPVKVVGIGAFYMDYEISALTLGKNITDIKQSAFFNCSNIVYVNIPDSVENIEGAAFDFCTGIEYVTIGKNVKNISTEAFTVCSNLRKVIVSEQNEYFKEVDNALYTKDGKILMIVPKATTGKFVVLDGTEKIANNAFFNSKYSTVVIPDSLTVIGQEAFFKAKISTIDGGKNLKVIEKSAFSSSTLSSITLYDSLEKIEYGAFSSCNIAKIVLPDSITEISENAFSSCASLKSVTLGKNTKTIFKGAFEGCAFESIEIPNSVEVIESNAFKSCINLTSVSLGKNISEVNEAAFYGCDKFSSIEISEENEIYSSVGGVLCSKDQKTLIIYPCGRTEISIPEVVTKIGYGAFYKSKLEVISIPDNVETIESNAFGYCENLTTIILGKNVSKIASDAFYGSTKFTKFEVSAENELFSTIDGILCSKDQKTLILYPCGKTECVIPESITHIGRKAFQDSVIKELVIPDNVVEIGEGAFSYCSKLTDVKIGKGVKVIGSKAFDICILIQNIVIPKNVETVGSDIFTMSYYLTIYCEAAEKPEGWSENWNSYEFPVEWNYSNEEA